jgi:hypothetical protein
MGVKQLNKKIIAPRAIPHKNPRMDILIGRLIFIYSKTIILPRLNIIKPNVLLSRRGIIHEGNYTRFSRMSMVKRLNSYKIKSKYGIYKKYPRNA